MMHCIIVEDQPPAQRILVKYINEHPNLSLLETFSDAISADTYLSQNQVDLIFLDIHLPKMSGLDFLKQCQHKPLVILTTAFPDYALESYEYDVIDYLLKPFSFNRFEKAIAKATTTHNSKLNLAKSKEENIVIKIGHELIHLLQKEILYIHSDADYTEIITLDKTYLSNKTLKHWLGELNGHFCQIHKSFIINLNVVDKVVSNTAFIAKENIPIGRAFKANFIEKYQSIK